MADDKACTAGQLALAWVHAQGHDVFPIPGTKRRTYLEENIAAFEIALSDDELATLDEIVPAVSGDRYPDMRWVQDRERPGIGVTGRTVLGSWGPEPGRWTRTVAHLPWFPWSPPWQSDSMQMVGYWYASADRQGGTDRDPEGVA